MAEFKIHDVPASRIATFDIYSVGLQRHHVSALLEFDVTDSRKKLRELKRHGENVSFNGWLISVIGKTIKKHPEAAGFLRNKKKLVTFDDVNITFIVEKNVGGKKVPIPLVIEKANEKSIPLITDEIEGAKDSDLSESDIIMNRKPELHERLYYRLPAFLRIKVWKYMLKNPEIAYGKMGNVIITSLGAVGKIKGWFVHKSVHPLSFGIGSVLEKPAVVKGEIKIREILNMTILLDHDVIDGAPMVRFLNDLTYNIENGIGL